MPAQYLHMAQKRTVSPYLQDIPEVQDFREVLGLPKMDKSVSSCRGFALGVSSDDFSMKFRQMNQDRDTMLPWKRCLL